MQLSGQAVSGTCSGFLKKEKFKEGRWTDVFTGVSEQLVRRGQLSRGFGAGNIRVCLFGSF